jgi:hypothetical protein
LFRFAKTYSLCLLGLLLSFTWARAQEKRICIDFYGSTFNSQIDNALILDVPTQLSQASVKGFYNKINAGNYQPVLDSLTAYKNRNQLNDWLYYSAHPQNGATNSPQG